MSNKYLTNQILLKIENGSIDLQKLVQDDKNPNFYYHRFKKGETNLVELVKSQFKQKPKTAPIQLLELLGLQRKDIIPESVKVPTEYNVFGCELSSDIDIMIRVESREIIDGISSGNYVIDDSLIRKQLEEDGYNLSRELDVSLIFYEKTLGKNMIVVSSKGDKENNNILLETYHLHKQRHSIFTETKYDVILSDKLRTVAKYILDYLEDLVGEEVYWEVNGCCASIYFVDSLMLLGLGCMDPNQE